MPDHVDHACDAKEGGANQREVVARRQSLIQAGTAGLVAQRTYAQKDQDGEESRVQHAVPGGEEGLQPGQVPVGPGIQVGARHQPGAEGDHRPLESPRRWNRALISKEPPCQLSSPHHGLPPHNQ